LLGAPVPAAAATPPLDPAATVAKGKQALGRTLGNYTLADKTGAPLALRDYRGKPLVVSLVYTACSSVCPPTTQHVIGAVNEAGRMIGLDRFNVLTIGFDARNDTPARLTQFASSQGIKSPNWQVASADPATIEALLGDLGFSYRAVAGGFDHLTQTTIIDREGRITATSMARVSVADVHGAAQGRRLRHRDLVFVQWHRGSDQVHLHRLRSWRRPLPYRLRTGVRQRDRGVLSLRHGRSHSSGMASLGARMSGEGRMERRAM
jgi:cytochrome oxidase Cu insertion factor (SCO1/SenC/PrrC family)